MPPIVKVTIDDSGLLNECHLANTFPVLFILVVNLCSSLRVGRQLFEGRFLSDFLDVEG